MKPGAGAVGLVVCCSLTLTACMPSRDRDLGLETRIECVVEGLQASQPRASGGAERPTLEERMEHYRVPAVSVTVIHDGSIHLTRACGTVDAGGNRMVSDETLFQAASISKTLTAFATLRVVEQGLLRLDVPVNRYLQSWRLPESNAGSADSVTVALLLAHMAGVNVSGFPGYTPGANIPTLIQVLDGATPANTPPIRIVQRPGSNWSYSGGGYVVIQQMLQDVTGLDFPALMDSLVLAPLGMEHSSFRQPLSAAQEVHAAFGHSEEGETLPVRWHVYPEQAAAGLWTTSSDLARFVLGIQSAASRSQGALLSAQSAEALTTPQFGAFSLGLVIRTNGEDRWFTFSGGNVGYRSVLYAYLSSGEGAVVMTNSDSGAALAAEIIDGVAREYHWPGFVPEGRQ